MPEDYEGNYYIAYGARNGKPAIMTQKLFPPGKEMSRFTRDIWKMMKNEKQNGEPKTFHIPE